MNFQRKRWCFTVNNYTEDEFNSIKQNFCERVAKFAVMGREIGSGGVPHLQGFISLQNKVRLTGIKAIVGQRAHVEPAKGTDQKNLEYCTKSCGVDGATIYGVPAGGVTEKGGGTPLSRRALECVRKRSAGTSISELLDDDTLAPAYIVHKRAIEECASDIAGAQQFQAERARYATTRWKPFQFNILKICMQEPHPRAVHWFWDAEGNTGKTFIAKYLVLLHDAVRFENGKSADIKYAYKGQRIVIFDFSRSQTDHINYEVMESVKNGIVFSPKYESGMKVFRTPHMICFANERPDTSNMSMDRWEIHEITTRQARTPTTLPDRDSDTHEIA
ncbi:replication associated protein [Cyanoramphus nest associated circular X DNA virus]|uniref:Replication associated protein n=1 Tax=Cyanoramphus nest associated circular X DNA virus TaxID=1282443 RepID=L7USS3_9VIRU|nr:replication associated protein [Cyanoramphus nest associated circular X DNA virus]AGC55146.1 replication associated protein [Cyanoramphus nest associated circular X DNA virus]